MDRSELTFARHHALTTKDWDTYQTIIRRCLRTANSEIEIAALPAASGTVRSVIGGAIGLKILALLPQVGGLQ